MASSNDSILNSIKGRIWLAVSALAVLDCFCGLGAYLAVSFLVTDTFITIFVTFFVLAFVTMVFGWWLANDVVRPIDSVTLLAKALERSPNATMPRTTGANETDELLRSLHRNSQQLQNLILMMDDVAAGKTDVITMPLENSDKLSASFQKLVSRVTESITAKRELDALQTSLTAINAEISGIRGGKLDVQIRAEHQLTREIADTIRFLTNRLEQLARGVQVSSAGAGSAAAEAKRVIRSVLEARDERSAKLSRGLSTVSELPAKADSLVHAADSAIAAFESVASANSGSDPSDDIAKATRLQSCISETARKVQKMRSRIAELPSLGRTANEIARKSNLIALNTAIHGEGAATSAEPSNLLMTEVNSLSQRAESLGKEIRSLAESLTSEVSEMTSAFVEISSGSGAVTRRMDHAIQVLIEYQGRYRELEAIRPKLSAFKDEQAAESQKIAELVNEVSNDRSDEIQIREAEIQLQKLMTLVENLRDSVSDLRSSNASPPPSRQSEILDSAPAFEATNSETRDFIGEN